MIRHFATLVLCLATAIAGAEELPLRASVESGWLAISGRPGFAAERPLLRALYAAQRWDPLWLEGGRPTDRARHAVAILESSGDDGLEPRDYDAAFLRAETARLGGLLRVSASDLARFDVSLSLAFLRFIADSHVGRVDPRTLGFDYDLGAKRAEIAPLAMRLADREVSVQEVARLAAPRLGQYDRLVRQLGLYRALAVSSALGPAVVPATIRPGDRFPEAPDTARWLHALGDLEAEMPGAESYEPSLVDGVRRFQRRHGLVEDGIIGRATAAALAVPATTRARQIVLALERLRWLPALARDRAVIVNAPAFEVLAFDAFGSGAPPALAMPVIVGRAVRTETPFFAASMTDVVFAPYWNVPSSILRHEILPHYGGHPEYLATERMEIVAGGRVLAPDDEALRRLVRGDAGLRQRPGAGNPLGRVKFRFPNPYSVYMHDTPTPELFLGVRRDFSHGCIRLSDAAAFARWVLAAEGWEPARVDGMLALEDETVVRLRRPIAVVVAYATAVARRDGTIDFHDDLYGHDAALARALAARTAVASASRDRVVGGQPDPGPPDPALSLR